MEPGDFTKKKKMMAGNPEIDMISNLPDTVLHQILSLLDMKQVVQTSVLSTKWRYVWTCIPILNFDYDLFVSGSAEQDERFKHFVDDVMLLRDSSSNIHRFYISNVYLNLECVLKSRLNSWILAALRRNVERIYLHLGIEFQWPSRLFTSTSLTTLELQKIFRLNLPNSMSLPNLKTLAFIYVEFEGDDIPNKIFSSCPVLESLTILSCEFQQTNVNILALKLKHLFIGNWGEGYEDGSFYRIKLYAPNLISFRCRDNVATEYSIDNLSALVKANIDIDNREVDEDGRYVALGEKGAQLTMTFLRELHNVQTLTLSPEYLKVVSEARALLESKPIQFCNLRCLKLRTWLSSDCVNAITYLLEISPNIQSLFLEMNLYGPWPMYPYRDEVMPNSAKLEVYQKGGPSLQCMLYHLKFVQIRGFEGRLNEIMLLELLLKNAIVLEKVVLNTCTQPSPRTRSRLIKLNEKLLSFPRASSSIAISLL